MNYSLYPKYKPSGIDWLGDIPENWELLKVKHLFRISEEASFETNPTILSLTQHGIKKRDITNNEGQIASSYSGYRKISIGDIVLNVMDMLSGFVDRSQYDGVISPAYTTLKAIIKIETKYFNYFFQKHYFEKIFFPFGQGVSVDHRWTLKDFTLLNFPIIKPKLEEQEKIAKFLDNKLEKIDQIIEKNNRLVELLKEKRQAVITHAVTKGLNPRVRLKPSGIDWLGDIPEDWEVKRLKYLAKSNVSTLSENTSPDFSFKYLDIGNVGTGQIIEKPSEIYFRNAPSRARRIVKKDDTIISTVRTYLKAIYYFEEDPEGMIVSTGFAVIEIGKTIYPKFFYYLSLSANFISSIVSNSYGVSYPAINESFIMTLPVWYPEIEEQEEIVKYLDLKTGKIDEAVRKLQLKNGKLQEYRQALISSAVTGKIQV